MSVYAYNIHDIMWKMPRRSKHYTGRVPLVEIRYMRIDAINFPSFFSSYTPTKQKNKFIPYVLGFY